MKLAIAVLFVLRFFIGTFVKPVIQIGFRLYYRKQDYKNPLPKCKSDLLLMPAHKLADKVRRKEITSTELVQTFIDRIKEINVLLNCVVETCFTEALTEAKNVDRILASDLIPEAYSEKNAPLLGVPFSCKESIWCKGMPNATGIISRKHIRVPDDADVVRHMRQAGAILTCLTNTSEACMWLESNNYLYGVTNNPYNLSRLVGGSSGGEACLVSSAGSVMGIGSDIGGSIRMPAFFNGVYGHKPSSNIINSEKQHPPARGIQCDMIATGPIARYASDLRLLFKILAGPDYEQVKQKFETKVDLKSLKYYFIRDLQGNLLVSDLSDDTKNALKKAVDCIEKSFNTKVTEIKLKKLKSAFQIWSSMMSNGEASSDNFGRLLKDSTEESINPYKELLKSITGYQKLHTLPAIGLALTERIPNPHSKHYIEMGKQLKQELKDILGDDGVLLFPSFPVVAPYHNQPIFTNTLDFVHYGIINAMGLPSTQCPMGLSSEGLPTGVQVISNHSNDHLTIRVAEYFEANLVGWTPV